MDEWTILFYRYENSHYMDETKNMLVDQVRSLANNQLNVILIRWPIYFPMSMFFLKHSMMMFNKSITSFTTSERFSTIQSIKSSKNFSKIYYRNL